ncbi:efflux transporter outer membrane subunit [Verrucomicrobiota bacterium]
MKHLIVTGVVILLCLACGCSRFLPAKNDYASDFVPETFSRTKNDSFTNSCWWTDFGSDELNGLVDKALKDNLSISAAAARLKQARAIAVQRGAARVPDISTGAAVSSTEREKTAIEGGDTRTESAELLLSASYELDLWGRVSAIKESASLDANASSEDLETVRLSIAAKVASSYFDLLYTRTVMDLVKTQVQTAKDILYLIEFRYRRSQATALDVLQQRELVAQTESLLPHLEAREEVALNALCVLTGLRPGTDLFLKKRILPALPIVPDTGLPLQLVERRPDIRSALFRLESAHYSVKAAKADRLPAIRLTASAGYSNSDISDIFDNWIARLAGNIAAPLIDGRRRKAEVDKTLAVLDERIADYRAVILKALTEVENALIREEKQSAYIDALKRQQSAAESAYNEASERYLKGAESYLAALRELNNLHTIQRQTAKARYDMAVFRVNLYQALAGTFNNKKENK